MSDVAVNVVVDSLHCPAATPVARSATFTDGLPEEDVQMLTEYEELVEPEFDSLALRIHTFTDFRYRPDEWDENDWASTVEPEVERHSPSPNWS